MATAYIGLGSNIGDRRLHLETAIEKIRRLEAVEAVRCSSFYETAPVGPVPQGDFLNAVAEVQTTFEPVDFLSALQIIENEASRKREVHWGPRSLDLDLLAVDGQELQTQSLTLPHPEAKKRAFVLVPWAELAPDFCFDKRPVVEWLQQVGTDGVRKFDC
ncbi:MAG: 2-amino-4-hydroxy-6-hydroxymethyldihydropteridine diphosphokinase [Verrucomicrobiota bacterium]